MAARDKKAAKPAAKSGGGGNGAGKGKLLGYARVSTTDQDLSVQREALHGAGVAAIFEEKASGTKRAARTELERVLGILGEGDTLVVTRLDRLGRSLRDLANVAHEIDEAGATCGCSSRPSTRRPPPAAPSSACSPSSRPLRPTSAASDSSKGLP
jgi:hypothetical protein